MAETQGVVFNLEPGSRIQMEVKGLDLKLHSFYVGMVKGRYLMVQLPVVADKNKEGLFPHLYQDNLVAIRYLQRGEVRGFQSKVIRYVLSPFPLLFLSYPAKIVTYALRKHKRVPCLVQASAKAKDGQSRAMITDLSQGGCLTLLPQNEASGLDLHIDDVVRVECPAFGAVREASLECKVMRVEGGAGRLKVGMLFANVGEPVSRAINGYIEYALEFLD